MDKFMRAVDELNMEVIQFNILGSDGSSRLVRMVAEENND